MNSEHYFDWAATAPCDEKILRDSLEIAIKYDGNPTEFISKLKGRAVTWEDPEFYREIGNVLKGNSVADISLQCNMKEGMYKLTHEYKKAQATFEAISGDATRYETAIKQIEQYQSRALSATELSSDAINLMESAQAQIECTHQFDKIRKIYENFNIKAMGSGAADGISEELRMIGQLTKPRGARVSYQRIRCRLMVECF